MMDLSLIEPQSIRRMTRAEYEHLASLGFFDDERVELLHGIIVAMSPVDPQHAKTVALLNRLLVRLLDGRAEVRPQLPVIADDESEPEPDLAVVPLNDDFARHPSEVLLAVEVALSSRRRDRLVKGPLYAASRFREYWLVDLIDRAVEVHRGPEGTAWRSITRHHPGDVLTIDAFPGPSIAVSDFLRS